MILSFLITGDFCPCLNDLDKDTFSNIKDILIGHDLIVSNLECAIKKGNEKPIIKEGPSLACNVEQLKYLVNIGKTLFTLANNHVMDYGNQGIYNIFEASKTMNVSFVGAGNNISEARKPFYFEKNNFRVAFINCCEHEFSIADENTPGANPMDIISIYKQIQEAKKEASIIIVIAHGGHEYYQLPSQRIQETYRFFIDAGANAVIGHHPHCISGMEIYKEGMIYYSLGNFYFNNHNKDKNIWNEGFCVELKIDTDIKKIISHNIIPYTQCLNNNKIIKLSESAYDDFNKKYVRLNKIIANKDILNKKNKEYFKSQERKAISRILPYTNKYLVALYKRGLLPSFLTKKNIATRLNAVRCEAHRDILISVLSNKLIN